MKALKNPYVVGGLALVAVVVVFRKSFPKDDPPPPPPPPASAKAKAAKAPAKKKPASDDPETVEPGVGIEADGDGFVQWPKRDPFDSNHRLMPKPKPRVEPTVEKKVRNSLLLSAVWVQDTGSYAVINGRIIGEGDSIEGYRVKRILSDHVVIDGRDGTESVQFKAVSDAPSLPTVVNTESAGELAPDGSDLE